MAKRGRKGFMLATVPMLVYVFVLGRAGCGKSAATRHMAAHLSQKWEIKSLTDYKLLHDLFRNGDPRFRASRLGGFDVIDFSALDEVLDKVEEQAKAFSKTPLTKNTLVTIEFARDDYHQALHRFDQDFLGNAYFLFIDAELEICIQRVHQRQEPIPYDTVDVPDDLLNNHFVSDTILRSYYNSSQYNRDYMSKHFCNDFSIDPQHIQFIDNNGEQKEFTDKIDRFLEKVAGTPSVARQPGSVGAQCRAAAFEMSSPFPSTEKAI